MITVLVQTQNPHSPVILPSTTAATNGCSGNGKNRTRMCDISPIYSPSFYFLLTGYAEPNPVTCSTILNGTIFQTVFILASTCTDCFYPYQPSSENLTNACYVEHYFFFACSEHGFLKFHCVVQASLSFRNNNLTLSPYPFSH